MPEEITQLNDWVNFFSTYHTHTRVHGVNGQGDLNCSKLKFFYLVWPTSDPEEFSKFSSDH